MDVNTFATNLRRIREIGQGFCADFKADQVAFNGSGHLPWSARLVHETGVVTGANIPFEKDFVRMKERLREDLHEQSCELCGGVANIWWLLHYTDYILMLY